jgi:thiaminase/transcriptional activator TenA
MSESAVASLLATVASEWQAATRHPFLNAVASDTLPQAAFNAWLAQDYLFVGDLLSFQARLLVRAPRADQAVLISGLLGLESELGWFETHAARAGLPLPDSRHAVTVQYRNLMEELAQQPYGVAVVGLWAIERAYHDAWQSALPGGPNYREFIEHWTVPAFADYVRGLELAASTALVGMSRDERRLAQLAVTDVARLEAAFWQMAWSESTS